MAANSSSGARKSGETTAEVIRDLKSEFETSSVSKNLKLAVNELVMDLFKLKNVQSGDASDEVKKLLGKYEEKIHRNTTLTDVEKTNLYHLTANMRYNSQNFEDIAAKLKKGGRCFLCSVFNVVMTIVAAVVVVVVVAVLLPAAIGGIAITATWLAVVGGSGAVIGGLLAAQDECWQRLCCMAPAG